MNHDLILLFIFRFLLFSLSRTEQNRFEFLFEILHLELTDDLTWKQPVAKMNSETCTSKKVAKRLKLTNTYFNYIISRTLAAGNH